MREVPVFAFTRNAGFWYRHVHERIGQQYGVWRDAVLLERRRRWWVDGLLSGIVGRGLGFLICDLRFLMCDATTPLALPIRSSKDYWPGPEPWLPAQRTGSIADFDGELPRREVHLFDHLLTTMPFRCPPARLFVQAQHRLRLYQILLRDPPSRVWVVLRWDWRF